MPNTKTVRVNRHNASKIPTPRQCEYEIECLPTDVDLEGSVATGDPARDERIINKIREQYENGNHWKWCMVKVTCRWNGYEGVDYLGGCSYASEENFKRTSGYYQDMKKESYNDMMQQIESDNSNSY